MLWILFQGLDLPLGEDCLKYMGKELKPPPAGVLTTAQISGMIATVVFSVVLLIVTAIIIRRLNKVIKVSEMANSRTSFGSQRVGSIRQRRRGPREIDIDALSVDPLMMSASEYPSQIRNPSQTFVGENLTPEPTGTTYPVFNSPFTRRSPPYTHYPRGYSLFPENPGNQSQSRRESQPFSDWPQQNPGYFDLPAQYPRGPSHSRNWTSASDQSEVSQSLTTELDAG